MSVVVYLELHLLLQLLPVSAMKKNIKLTLHKVVNCTFISNLKFLKFVLIRVLSYQDHLQFISDLWMKENACLEACSAYFVQAGICINVMGGQFHNS